MLSFDLHALPVRYAGFPPPGGPAVVPLPALRTSELLKGMERNLLHGFLILLFKFFVCLDMV